MESQLDRLERRLDSIGETQTQMRVDLGEHMRRTAVAEQKLELLEGELRRTIRLTWVLSGVAIAGSASRPELLSTVLKFLGG